MWLGVSVACLAGLVLGDIAASFVPTRAAQILLIVLAYLGGPQRLCAESLTPSPEPTAETIISAKQKSHREPQMAQERTAMSPVSADGDVLYVSAPPDHRLAVVRGSWPIGASRLLGHGVYSGIAPSCCISFRVSVTPQCSAAFPSSKRMMSIPPNSMLRPVAGIPAKSPWWVPVQTT